MEELRQLDLDFRDLDATARNVQQRKGTHESDHEFALLLLRNLRVFYQRNAVGKRTTATQQLVDGVSMAIFSPDMREKQLIHAGSRSLGVDIRRPFANAMALQGINSRATSSAEVQTGIARAPAVHAVDLDFVFDFFHSCEMYTVDKSRPKLRLKIKRVVAGKTRDLRCQPALLNGTKKDAVRLFWASSEYTSWLNCGLPFVRPLSERVVARCICKCMKEASIRECGCTYCIVMKSCLYKAFVLMWKQIKSDSEECACGSCGCGSPLQKATISFSDFIEQVTCAAVRDESADKS